MASWPCSNPSCKSHGRPHPNCRCPQPMAEGGELKPYCSSDQKHLKGCEYYADGGPVLDHPSVTLGHSASNKGLLGLLKYAGNSTMQDPGKHIKVLQAAKDHHMVKGEFPDTPKPRTMGGRLGHHIAEGNHEDAASIISGHPLTGLVGKTHLTDIMQQLGHPSVTQEPHPAAFRSSVDYLAGAARGKDALDRNIKSLIDGNSSKVLVEHDSHSIENLKEHLDKISANPAMLLDAGGDLGHYLPDHTAQLAATVATATTYLSSLKPMNIQNSPLDAVLKPSKVAVATYNRQLGLAQNPLMILQHTKDGTLLPTDIHTLQTIYPSLYKTIVDKIGDQLINATTKDTVIPYKMRASLGMLLGQPLDSTMTTGAMQAIIASAMPKSGGPQPKKGSSATTLKAENAANKMAETPLQARQINKK